MQKKIAKKQQLAKNRKGLAQNKPGTRKTFAEQNKALQKKALQKKKTPLKKKSLAKK